MSSLAAATLLSLKIYGLAIVISLAVALLIRVVGAVTSLAGGSGRARATAPPAAAQAPGVPPAHVAAIAAAVSAALGAHRIVHIEERTHGQAWTEAGRGAHHGSHVVAPHTRRPASPTRRR